MAQQADSSETGVAIRALSHIRKPAITSIDDDTSDTTLVVKKHFATVRDALLRQYPWNFAEDFATLPAMAETPLFDFNYFYLMPQDCLWVRKVKGCGSGKWKVMKGRRIACNLRAPLKIAYTRRVVEVPLWDALFSTAFAMHLAVACAPELAADENIAASVANTAAEMLAQAYPPDAAEQGDVDLPDTDWVTCRR